ncbi:pyrroloquinoline quinone-dependent dehydrogenase [Derxia gummosa]|uniref:Pyrroloquinoline quinone-dependent dehydrogenase n=1 Tax=Derxia gummosa DSM 723 TaxID=1121388 RepID=A0A8B6X8P3_9BURK|nr:PQQ-binding-like beta-propeller repeat protein [Derxia gummosa]
MSRLALLTGRDVACRGALGGTRPTRIAAALLACLAAGLAQPPAARADDAADWPGYGRTPDNRRHSPVTEITPANVGRLVPKWIYQTGIDGSFQTSPVVIDGVVYLSTPRNNVVALDGITGEPRWKYGHRMQTDDLCCGTHNRGVAVGDGRVYEITADARLIALDQATGRPLWDVPVHDPGTGAPDAPEQVRNADRLPAATVAGWRRYSGIAAPLFHDGLVIVGTSGSGYTSRFSDQERGLQTIGRAGPREGSRAFVSAYAADTGRLVWRWYSTADHGWEGGFVERTSMGDPLDRDLATERANADRYRDAWKRGGGSIHSTPALDAEAGLLYVGTGNAAPYADLYRPGDNLYTASLVALDVKTGALRWFHQITPHDIWGYDVAAAPILLDVPVGEARVPGVAVATKSGWVYFFDRRTGALLRRSEGFVPQTRLFPRPRDETGVIAVPGEAGGANWQPGSYSPRTGWLYITGSHFPSRFALETDADGNRVNVLTFPKQNESWGTVSAIDPATGRLVWQQRLARPFAGGVTTTAGGLAFIGEADGYFTARDARTGARLWRFQTGAGVGAPAVVYEAGGHEYVLVAAGGNRLFDNAPGNAVIAFGLPDAPESPAPR